MARLPMMTTYSHLRPGSATMMLSTLLILSAAATGVKAECRCPLVSPEAPNILCLVLADDSSHHATQRATASWVPVYADL